jgi:hypothetical protein
MILTDYQIIIIVVMVLMNLICAFIVVFVCYALIRFKEFREAIVEAIQNGDKIYHWIDAKSFGFFVAGFLSAWFTMNMSGAFVYAKMFDVGAMAFIGLFVAITFTLWGIAWKK